MVYLGSHFHGISDSFTYRRPRGFSAHNVPPGPSSSPGAEGGGLMSPPLRCGRGELLDHMETPGQERRVRYSSGRLLGLGFVFTGNIITLV